MNKLVSRLALLTLSAFLAACPAANTASTGPTGPSGGSNPSAKPTAEELCVGDATPCGKWKKQCRKDCFVLPAGEHRDECTDTCNSTLSACEETCAALKDPSKFNPETDWVDMPPKPKAYAPDCGGEDQEACTDLDKYDACQPDFLKVDGAEDGPDYCFKKCKTSADADIDPATFSDECDTSHLCTEVKTNVRTCVPAQCDPAKGTHSSACRIPVDRCHGGLATKANYGFCDLTCRTEEKGTCPAQTTCYPLQSKDKDNNIIPFNICLSKAPTTLSAIGAACALDIKQDNTGAFTTATENCVAGGVCTGLQTPGASGPVTTKCYKSCWDAAQSKTNNALCTDTTTECKGVASPDNALGLPQGNMYLCVPKPTRQADELQLNGTF